MTEGAVGCLMLFEGRRSLRSRVGEATAAITGGAGLKLRYVRKPKKNTAANAPRDDEV